MHATINWGPIIIASAGIVKEACSGLGTDDEQLIKVLCCRTKTQLERIDQAYRTRYEKTLWEKVRRLFAQPPPPSVILVQILMVRSTTHE